MSGARPCNKTCMIGQAEGLQTPAFDLPCVPNEMIEFCSQSSVAVVRTGCGIRLIASGQSAHLWVSV